MTREDGKPDRLETEPGAKGSGRISFAGMTIDIPPESDLPAEAPFEGKTSAKSVKMPKDVWELLPPLVEVATNTWRLRKRMVDAESGEPTDEMRRLFRFVEGIQQALHNAGITVIDKEGKAYDPGMREKVIGFEKTPGLLRDEIIETVRPAIRFRERLLFAGEIIVGTPEGKLSEEGFGSERASMDGKPVGEEKGLESV